jgi:uncharacterized RDD family membrane protein YckC
MPAMADPPRRRSFGARMLGSGARSARALAGATGIDTTIEAATEDAIVAAMESAAVERALVRLLEGPAFQDAVAKALDSPAVERAVLEALDSGMVDRVWDKLLESDEVQRLIERIAEAPEVRAAIASQGIGLIEDIGRQLGGISRNVDDGIERVVRRVLRRPQRAERSNHAGLMTRGLALLLDFGIINLMFVGVSALVALVFGQAHHTAALVLGATFWIVTFAVYLTTFWSLAGQSPGMRLLGIDIVTWDGDRRIGLRRAVRRLVGLVLALIPLGLGLIGVITRDERRGFHDRLAGTDVIYVPRAGVRGPVAPSA